MTTGGLGTRSCAESGSGAFENFDPTAELGDPWRKRRLRRPRRSGVNLRTLFFVVFDDGRK
jgi:hypothetical protein